MPSKTAFAFASGLAALCVSAIGAPPVIYNLGVFPSGTETRGAAVSHDGKFATGYGDVITGPTNDYAFRWSIAGGLINLGVPLGQQNSKGSAINYDGTVIAGTSDYRVFRWTLSGGMQDLAFPGVSSSSTSTSGISASGSVIVGTCLAPDFYNRGFRWTANTGYVLLSGGANNVGVTNTSARGVSGDGYWTVGTFPGLQYGPFACGWTAAGNLALFSGTHPWGSAATAISTNGTVVVGQDYDGTFFRHSGPNFSSLINYGPNSGFTPLSANYDGKVVVGSAGPVVAIYWNLNVGKRDLNVFLPQLGANISGWVLKEATGVSSDGTVIVGTGTYNGDTRAFVVTGMPCISTPIIDLNPTARSVCSAPGASATLSVGADGPGQLEYLWHVESPAGSGVFEPITGSHFADSTGQSFEASGWEGPDLTITGMRAAPGRNDIWFHVQILNLCGPVFSVPARIVKCNSDLDCNETVDDADFVVFAAAYNDLLCPEPNPGLPPYCPGDLNSDGMVDDSDFVEFATAYNALLCV